MKTVVATLVLIGSLLCAPLLQAEPVNVNTASAQEIAKALPGIGESKAQAIVDHREKEGPFKTADDLAKVKGIGDKTLEKIRPDILL